MPRPAFVLRPAGAAFGEVHQQARIRAVHRRGHTQLCPAARNGAVEPVDLRATARLKGHLKRDVSRIGAIMEQLLAAARLGGPGVDMTQRIDLADLAWRMVADYALLYLDRDRRVEFEERETPVFVLGDRRAIESVVANLLDNALRAEPSGGSVLVRVRDDAVLEVIDHGEGVPPEDRETIFEPFWRKSETTPGTGLGLAIARDLTTKLSGRIWVEDTPGGGATFKISLRASPD